MRPLAPLLALLVGCGGPPDPDRVAAASRAFSTEQCRASAVVPARPHPGEAPGSAAWRPPAADAVDLLRAEAEIRGEASGAAGPLAAFDASALAGLRTRSGGELVYELPMPDGGLAGATRIRVTLRPGATRALSVVPSPEASISRRAASLRRVDFSLDDPGADGLVVLEGRIDEALRGNWGDDKKHSGRLMRLRLTLPDHATDPPVVEALEVLDEAAEFAGEPAGRRVAGREDVLHPAWFAHAGATVRLAVSVPDGPVALRWYDGSLGDVLRVVTVVDGEARTELSRRSRRPGPWRPESVDLSAWAGREVVLELAVSGAGGVALFGAPRLVPLAPEPATPNVILVLIDTLRADHVGAWGSPVPGVTPTLDRLSAEGTQFALAQSTSAWTKPAIPTLLTGLWPTHHQVGAVAYTDELPGTVPTVQDRLREAGWRTGSFSSSPLGSTLSGLERGFDTAMPPVAWAGRLGGLGHVAADQLHHAMFEWVDEEPDRPFFAYIHTLEVHGWRRALYRHPPEGWTTYDAAVHDADDKLGQLVAELERRGLAENTLLVVTSDHGESFGDHGVEDHGTGLYQSQIHVPLVLWAGGSVPAQTVTHPVSLADVTPTIVDLVGLPAGETDGLSLRPYVDGPVAAPLHEAVPSARVRYIWRPNDPKWFAWTRADGLKTVRIGHTDRQFDLSRDLCEGQSEPYVSVAMRTALDAWLAAQDAAARLFREAHGGGEAGALDASDVELLRELGYLE